MPSAYLVLQCRSRQWLTDQTLSTMVDQTSGYEADFVEKPSQQYECPVCLLVLREPYLLSCCGIKVCHPCVTRIQNTTPAVCPMCRETFTAMMDKQLNRLILDLAVRCPLKSNGCKWVGELLHVNEHTASVINGCQFVEVSCSGLYPRHALQQHETENCVNRPIDERIERRISEMHDKLRVECDRRVSRLEVSMKLMEEKHDQKITQLEDELKQLRLLVVLPKENNADNRASSSNNIFANLNPDVLLLMPKLETFRGIQYFPQEGRVEVTATDSEERNKVISNFQESYQNIVSNCQLKTGTLELAATCKPQEISEIID